MREEPIINGNGDPCSGQAGRSPLLLLSLITAAQPRHHIRGNHSSKRGARTHEPEQITPLQGTRRPLRIGVGQPQPLAFTHVLASSAEGRKGASGYVHLPGYAVGPISPNSRISRDTRVWFFSLVISLIYNKHEYTLFTRGWHCV